LKIELLIRNASHLHGIWAKCVSLNYVTSMHLFEQGYQISFITSCAHFSGKTLKFNLE
jgi:hypothetical protein